jgi:serine/threonine protein phosphatase 1
VHGGVFPRNKKILEIMPYYRMWDRELIFTAIKNAKPNEKYATEYEEVFVGHTTTRFFNSPIPIHVGNVWNLDTGAGEWEGKLTIMNVDTKEFWQSDFLKNIYPEETKQRIEEFNNKKKRILQKGW